MWTKASNGEAARPAEVSIDNSGVIVRKDYHHIDAAEDMPEHWEYMEWQMSPDQYEVFKALMEETSDIEDALIELAEIIIGG